MTRRVLWAAFALLYTSTAEAQLARYLSPSDAEEVFLFEHMIFDERQDWKACEEQRSCIYTTSGLFITRAREIFIIRRVDWSVIARQTQPSLSGCAASEGDCITDEYQNQIIAQIGYLWDKYSKR
jgi:hypothetical protein